MGSNIKWVKLSTDIFDNRKIRQIECLPEGDGIIVVWLKLLCLAGNVNDNGMIYFTKDIPYTEQMLAAQFNRPIALIQLALKTFEAFKMIQIVENILQISNWEKYQNAEKLNEIREYNRIAQQRSRAKKKLLQAVNDNVNDKSMTVKGKEVDIEEEIEYIRTNENKNKKLYNNIYNQNRTRESYDQIMDDCELEQEVRPMMSQFIKHCALNGHRLTNEKLSNICITMDFQHLDAPAKIAALQKAISGGYYDIKRS